MPMAEWLHKYPQVQALLQRDEDELVGASGEEALGDGCPRSILPPWPWARDRALLQSLLPPAHQMFLAMVGLLRSEAVRDCPLRCRISPSLAAALLCDLPSMTGFISSPAAGERLGWLSGVELVVDPTVALWQFEQVG